MFIFQNYIGKDNYQCDNNAASSTCRCCCNEDGCNKDMETCQVAVQEGAANILIYFGVDKLDICSTKNKKM